MGKCVVKKCESRSQKHHKASGISFHGIPKDPVRREKWVEIIRLLRKETDWLPTIKTTICSNHFRNQEKIGPKTDSGIVYLYNEAVPMLVESFYVNRLEGREGMALAAWARLLQTHCLQMQPCRLGHRMRGKPPTIARNLQQRLEEISRQDPLYTARTDIGFPGDEGKKRATLTSERQAHIKQLKNDKKLEQLARNEKLFVDPEQVRNDWLQTAGPVHMRILADHYAVFQHLYGEGYFTPRVSLDVGYEQGNNTVLPVYYGNIIKPREATDHPVVTYEAEENSLWTLVLTGLDSHLEEAEKEYVHWLVANIPGNNVDRGDSIVEYLQPIPPRGTGFHRYVFVLYKQNSKINFDLERVDLNSPLDSRTFVTRDWYQRHQDSITPAGLAFYQSDWDSSLTDFYHHTLNMKEPVYEYDFPKPYVKPQEWFPLRQPFNLYMDRYRDPKQINKEYLLRKLKKEHPFRKPDPPLQFPNAYPFPKNMPSWLMVHERKIRLGWGRVNDV